MLNYQRVHVPMNQLCLTKTVTCKIPQIHPNPLIDIPKLPSWGGFGTPLDIPKTLGEPSFWGTRPMVFKSSYLPTYLYVICKYYYISLYISISVYIRSSVEQKPCSKLYRFIFIKVQNLQTAKLHGGCVLGSKTQVVTTQYCWLGHLTFSSSSTDVLKGAAVTSSVLHDMPSLLLASYLVLN